MNLHTIKINSNLYYQHHPSHIKFRIHTLYLVFLLSKTSQWLHSFSNLLAKLAKSHSITPGFIIVKNKFIP